MVDIRKLIPICSSPLTVTEANALDVRTLAFVGDTVESLFIRSYYATTGNLYGKLHTLSSNVVNANTQSKNVDDLSEKVFNASENAIYLKGRNKHCHYMAKHASAENYHKASGLETVLGYLYLTGQNERLTIILSEIIKETL